MNASAPKAGPSAQSGAVLMTTLVMLVVLTMIVVAGINLTNINTKIAYNMQTRNEAQAATQQAIEQTISNLANFTVPLPPPATVRVDINNDGAADYAVTVATPTCVAAVPIKQAQLDPTNANDIGCFGTSSLQNSGIVGGTASNGNSLCTNTTWDVKASYSDPASSGLGIVTHQGINMKVVAGTTC